MALIAYSPSSALSLSSLVEGILAFLYGQTSQTDATAALVQDISATDLSFKVDDPTDFSAGYVEIDTELIRVISVDLSTSTITIAPRGRGHRGTTAAAHTAGAEIRIQPIVPYQSVIRDIQAELNSIYPKISAVSGYELTPGPSVHSYTLPTDAGLVLDVRYLDNTNEWQRVRDWEVEHGGAAGPVLRLPSIPGSTVRVIYGRPFGKLSSLADTLAAAGVPESLEDVIRYGVVCRLLPSLDVARLSVTATAGSDMNNRPPTPGTGVMVARELRAAYRERLDQEIKTFRSYFPVRLHNVR